MITKAEIETYAAQIAEVTFEMDNIEPLIGHLGDVEMKAIMARAAAIAREGGRAAQAEADSMENVLRLAQAAGCPEGAPVIPWLAERGLIEKIGNGWRFKVAKPNAVG